MWKLLGLLICCYTTFDITAAKSRGSCSIKLPGDMKGFGPVILTSVSRKDYQFFKPTGEVSSLKAGTKLLLACTGKKNVFKDTKFNTMELKCYKGNFVDINKTVQTLSKLLCETIPKAKLKLTSEKCSNNNGFIYKTGFNINGQFFGPVFEMCYNNVTEHTFYTHDILDGAALAYSVPEPYPRSFKATGMNLTTTKANKLYQQRNQIKRFENYFGKNQTFIDKNNFLARGHLAADADFIFGYEQLATFYYVNAAPEYQLINAGNWLRVEELARAVAVTYKDDIETYNSYRGTLELPNREGVVVKIYLDDAKKIAVPKYFYKVLVHRASDSAIVLVTVNNPFVKDGSAEEFCTNVCEKSAIFHPNFPDTTKGYTFCCELNKFKTFVDSLPDDVHGSNLMMRYL